MLDIQVKKGQEQPEKSIFTFSNPAGEPTKASQDREI